VTSWRQLLAALSGALLVLSFPKFGHWSVAWIALVPLLVALRGATGGQGFRLGYITGFVSSVGLLYWTSLTVLQFGGLGEATAVAVMVLLCLAVALFAGLYGWCVGRWSLRFGPHALLLSPLAWVATEILRAHVLYRFSWCLLGYSQLPNRPFIQIASATAVYGVSFLVAGAAGVLAYVVTEPERPRRLRALLGLGLVLGAVGLQGWRRLAEPPVESGRLRVALIQASIPQDQKWEPRKAWENVERHLTLTREAVARGARLVVWPESALPFLYDEEPGVASQLQALSRGDHIYLLFGNDDREERRDGRIWVGAKMLTPEGRLSYRYHKIRLVPFGEYVPLQPLLTLGGRYAARLVRQVGEFTPGDEPEVGEVDGHHFGTLICFEVIFPDLVREFTARGADLIVNITNDAWYGYSSAPHQHLAMAAFRAVENGKYLVRAANTGITAVVDPRGRIEEKTALFDRTLLVRDVPIVSGQTFYSRHGDVFAWTCFALAAALTVLGARTRSSPETP
jgi:apolipoprotein N-acyltransferase